MCLHVYPSTLGRRPVSKLSEQIGSLTFVTLYPTKSQNMSFGKVGRFYELKTNDYNVIIDVTSYLVEKVCFALYCS